MIRMSMKKVIFMISSTLQTHEAKMNYGHLYIQQHLVQEIYCSIKAHQTLKDL